MTDTYQAATVAVMTEDGGIYHDEHFRSVIRYMIREMEAEKAWKIEQHPEHYSEDLVMLMERRDALKVALAKLNDSAEAEAEDAADVVDVMLGELDHAIEEMVDSLSKVVCDECGEPIE